ncbi:MAG: GNAT family N-acetyltransferase [Rhodobacteraceae bacterium]|nr:GNAT family N-acetyltransferase [Paracoccaceae bacterium]
MTPEITVTNDLDACLHIRRIVFIEEQGVSEADEVDGLDDQAVQFLATDNGQPVGTARMLIKGGDAKVGRVAVLKERRGIGLGAALIRATVSYAAQTPGVNRVVLGAQTHAIGFYEQLGFSAFGPVYDDAGIPHRDMDIPV